MTLASHTIARQHESIMLNHQDNLAFLLPTSELSHQKSSDPGTD